MRVRRLWVWMDSMACTKIDLPSNSVDLFVNNDVVAR